MGLGGGGPTNANNQANSASSENNTATTNASATSATNTNPEGQLPRIAIPSMGRPRRVIIRQSGTLEEAG